MNKLTFLLSLIFVSSCSLFEETLDYSNISKTLSNVSEFISPHIYKKDIKQGSVVRTEKLKFIKNGMSKDEVRDIIGSPIILDQFHQNQWEYVHHSILKDDSISSYRLTLFFENDKLVKSQSPSINLLEEIEKENINFNISSNPEETEEAEEDKWYKFW